MLNEIEIKKIDVMISMYMGKLQGKLDEAFRENDMILMAAYKRELEESKNLREKLNGISKNDTSKKQTIEETLKEMKVRILEVSNVMNSFGECTGIDILFEMPNGKRKIKSINFRDIIRQQKIR